MKILFLTTHNLATNPRIVKEIELALANGFSAELVCFEFDNWSKQLNEELKARLSKVKIHTIKAGRKPLLPWMFNVFTEKVYRLLGKVIPLPLAALSQALSRRNKMLVKALINIGRADFVVGHNPGALFPTLVAAKKFNCPMGFDVEDYHAGEGNNTWLQHLTRKFMCKLLPQMSYVSFAAPLIMQQVQHDTGANTENWFTVLNYFPAKEFTEPFTLSDGPLKMVWFSQNINAGRGLELILPFVKQSKDTIELHLAGNLNRGFYEEYLKNIPNIIVHPPMKQKDLHLALGQFDIGLALEPAKDKNNELAISNKILAYLQAGLYVVATNTSGQQSFLHDLPEHGVCFDYKANNVSALLGKIIGEPGAIRKQRANRYKNFQNRNWEAASLPLVNAWK